MNALPIKHRKGVKIERLKQKTLFYLIPPRSGGWNSHFRYALVKPSQKSKENIFTFLRIVLNYREMSLTERNGNAAHKTDELCHPDVDVLRS